MSFKNQRTFVFTEESWTRYSRCVDSRVWLLRMIPLCWKIYRDRDILIDTGAYLYIFKFHRGHLLEIRRQKEDASSTVEAGMGYEPPQY